MSSSVKITLYAKPEVKERLQERADADRRSLSEWCLLKLEEHVDRRLPLESQAIVGRDIIDMHTHEKIGELPESSSRSVAVRRPRTVTCAHRLAPDQFCKECDA